MSKEEEKNILIEVQAMKSDIAELREEIKPILEALRTAGSLKKGLIWISAFLLSLTAIVGSLKAIFNWMK